MKKPKLSLGQRGALRWLRDKAIAAWEAGKWEQYARLIRKADAITRRG